MYDDLPPYAQVLLQRQQGSAQKRRQVEVESDSDNEQPQNWSKERTPKRVERYNDKPDNKRDRGHTHHRQSHYDELDESDLRHVINDLKSKNKKLKTRVRLLQSDIARMQRNSDDDDSLQTEIERLRQIIKQEQVKNRVSQERIKALETEIETKDKIIETKDIMIQRLQNTCQEQAAEYTKVSDHLKGSLLRNSLDMTLPSRSFDNPVGLPPGRGYDLNLDNFDPNPKPIDNFGNPSNRFDNFGPPADNFGMPQDRLNDFGPPNDRFRMDTTRNQNFDIPPRDTPMFDIPPQNKPIGDRFDDAPIGMAAPPPQPKPPQPKQTGPKEFWSKPCTEDTPIGGGIRPTYDDFGPDAFENPPPPPRQHQPLMDRFNEAQNAPTRPPIGDDIDPTGMSAEEIRTILDKLNPQKAELERKVSLRVHKGKEREHEMYEEELKALQKKISSLKLALRRMK